ncbi:NeuD/PglB/VioB family sugar acetyltransferase [Bacillus sp. FJAT-49705]|uniref:NeuD/PglB/VioB family sugar acetyltransferase n=1 Tax=Cytobacillus citreus TaxID=2833586 RepID=A0ABS5NXR0_9BACI|nr:NeuD/PglB/VioB family sugar acetyltransferase [Cytobacillus citreus]MBS4192611.1 NeuD/PglB/VioB family sugar acetyltransferase [Cytobacillus citreus]
MNRIPTYIIGTGGLGRGVLETVKAKAQHEANWEIAGFFDDYTPSGEIINGVRVLGTTEELKGILTFSNILIAIASPKVKETIYQRVQSNPYLFFPNLIHPSVKINDSVNLGKGNILSENVVMSANVEVGDFNLVHFNATLGHDVKIGNYTGIYPGCNVSGYSVIKDSVLVGTNAAILPSIIIEKNTTVGAGAVVTKDIEANCRVAGVPAEHINSVGQKYAEVL